MSRVALSPVTLAVREVAFGIAHALVVALAGHALAKFRVRAQVGQAVEVAFAVLSVLDLWNAGVSYPIAELTVLAPVRRLLAEVRATHIFVEHTLIAVVVRVILLVDVACAGVALRVLFAAHSIRPQQGAGELHV